MVRNLHPELAVTEQVFRTYRTAIQQALRAGDATEHTYRPALKTLLEALDTEIVATNEPKRVECGAPDYAVSRAQALGHLTVGNIEAKDAGTDLDAIDRDSARKSPRTPNGEQLQRYRAALENLILTDYLEFRWYIRGQLRAKGRVATTTDSKLVRDREGEPTVAKLLAGFFAHRPVSVSKPEDLARRMARLTHEIRDAVVAAFEKDLASGFLRELRKAFADVLLPGLAVDEFADMYAQTLGYGLFAARVQHDRSSGPFRRVGAAAEIPQTNPFLRRLFHAITGPDLDDEPYVGFVDDLVQLLDVTDIGAVLAEFGKETGRRDPIFYFYEEYLKEYDPKIRELRGVYYTPEPVVSYIVRSVDHLLKTRFGLPDGLADTAKTTYAKHRPDGTTSDEDTHCVLVLDPACGTGTFLYSVVDLIRSRMAEQGNAGQWPSYVYEHLLPRLFGFELMMAPYAVAHLKLGMQLAAQDLPESDRPDWAYRFAQDERLGIYLTNSLEQAVRRSELLMGGYIAEEANEAGAVKQDLPVMVVLGNPPYSGHSANASVQRGRVTFEPGAPYLERVSGGWETRNAKRRVRKLQPTFIGQLLGDYYRVDGQPLGERNPKWLQDDYVKFIRFGQWRIEQTGAGVLAFITNHGYLDNPTFRGMRQQLMQAFTDIYILDLHGNLRKRETAPDGGPDKNVFDIQQGVCIGVFVRESGKPPCSTIHHADLWGLRDDKYAWLTAEDASTTPWQTWQPTPPDYSFKPRDTELQAEYDLGWKITDAMPAHASTITSGRNSLLIAFSAEEIRERMAEFASLSVPDEAIRRKYKLGVFDLPLSRGAAVSDEALGSRVRQIAFRPFDIRYTFYADYVTTRPRTAIMRHMTGSNVALLTHRPQSPGDFTYAFITNLIADQCVAADKSSGGGNSYQFPLYLYPVDRDEFDAQQSMAGLSPWPEGEDGRRPNLAPSFVEELQRRLRFSFVPDGRGDLEGTLGPEDVAHYIYAVLHSPTYRDKYAEFLKTGFPRIPLTSDRDLFRSLVSLGGQLATLHLLESPLLDSPGVGYPVPGSDEVEPRHPRYVPSQVGKPCSEGAGGRVYVNRGSPKEGEPAQFFEGVPPEAWEFQIGGYQVCEKWLKDRRGRVLSYDDQQHYKKMVVAIRETIRLMKEIDAAIPGWPIE